MNKALYLICITVLFISSPAVAEKFPTFYAGASYNDYDIDFSNADLDSAKGFGLIGGMEFKHGLAAEIEYNDSGKTDFDYSVGAITGGKIQVRSFSAYGIYRTPGNVYFKAKGGLTYNDVEVSDLRCSTSFCINSFWGEDIGLALGLGGGVKIGAKLRTELEYTLIDEDIDFWKLGLLFSF